MDDKELSELSYKELQLLATQHHVPANMKKKTMINVLRAAQNGDQSTVNQILRIDHQSRKKRTKKLKNQSDKKEQYRTPIDYYPSAFHPSHLVGSKINVMENKDSQRVNVSQGSLPPMPNFQGVFWHQRLTNGGGQPPPKPSNLSTNVSSTVQDYPLDLQRPSDPLKPRHAYNSGISSVNSEQTSPKLLKSMLQAPSGSNLRDFVASNGHYWPSVPIPAQEDDSDTQTAESECDENDNDKNIFNNFLRSMNENRNWEPAPPANRFVTSHAELPHWMNSYIAHQTQQYPEMSQQLPYDYRTCRNNEQQAYQLEYQGNPQPTGSYNVNQAPASMFDQNSYYPSSPMPPVQNNPYCSFNESDIYSQNNVVEPLCNVEVISNVPKYDNFDNSPSINPNNVQAARSYEEYGQYGYHQEIPVYNHAPVTTAVSFPAQQPSTTIQAPVSSVPSTVGDYWPHWNSQMYPNFENIVNLKMKSDNNRKKTNHTSSVYCYLPPVIAAKPNVNFGAVCSAEKCFWAEKREFYTVREVYNDSSMGRTMTNMVKPSVNRENRDFNKDSKI